MDLHRALCIECDGYMTRWAVAFLLVTGFVAAAGDRNQDTGADGAIKLAIQNLEAEPPNYVKQKDAADRLARLGASAAPAVPALIKVLGQPLVTVGGDNMSPVPGFEEARAAARRAIRSIGTTAVPALIAALQQSSAAGGHAASLLAELRDPRAVQPLVQAIGGVHDPAVQQALIDLELREVNDAVASRLNDPDARVRRGAGLVLVARQDVRALPGIVAVLTNGEQYQRWEAVGHLATLRPVDVRERLQALLKDADYMVRSEAASRLGDVGDSRDVPPLIALLGDPQSRVRWGAARALGLLHDARALAPLRSALKAESDEGNRQTMVASIAAITKK